MGLTKGKGCIPELGKVLFGWFSSQEGSICPAIVHYVSATKEPTVQGVPWADAFDLNKTPSKVHGVKAISS